MADTKRSGALGAGQVPVGFADISGGAGTEYALKMVAASSSGTAGPAGTSSDPSYVKPASYSFLGYQQIADATLAASSAMTVPGSATTAIIQNNGTTAVRWRVDGSTTAPTASTGQRIVSGGTLTLDVGNASLITTRFIREAAGATLDITYYA